MAGFAGAVVQAGTIVFGANGDVPVDEAVRDLRPLFADVLSDGFTGRRWLIEQIDAFLAERPGGYLWVEGDAGVGKTALAAHLVRERGWPAHFSRLTRGGSARGALRNLAGQLARSHGLVPDGLLPERWCTPEGFEALLARVPTPLVLVVDGADEAEQVAGAQPWGLPLELPPGVFVVGTYRTGSPPPKAGSVLRLTAADPRNIADVESHVARVQPDGDLVTRCGGVWVYLRYVLNEIRQGIRSATDPLPADLTSYYVENLERWSRSDWPNLLPLISTLTVAGEPLGARELARLSDVDENLVREHCHRTLRPFLGAVDGQAGRGFAWYHASLREFLLGVRPADDSPEQDWRWWDTLTSATTTAHNRVAEHYLNHFGSLEAGLPALVDSPTLANVDNGYPLRHLARHLVAAGRADDVHQLLRADDPTRQGPPAWFAAHDQADTVDDFLADVALARDLHARAADQALLTGQPAPQLCDEALYDLMVASVVSRTNAISAELVAALVSGGVWTSARAVAHALRLGTTTARAHVLAMIAAESPDAGVLALARTEAEKIESPYPRVEVLLKLIPLDATARPDLVAKALHAAENISGDHHRACAIADLAGWLNRDQLGTARRLADEITHPPARAQVLTALGDETGALRAVSAISGEQERAEALTALVPHLAQRRLHRAMAVAWSITGHNRMIARAAVSLRLPERDMLLAELLKTPVSPDHKAIVHAALAPHLPAAVDSALSAVADMGDPDRRADVLAELAPFLSWRQLSAALRDVKSPRARMRCLTAFAAHLAEPAEILRRAHSAAIMIPDAHDRAEALIELAPLLPTATRRRVLGEALVAATAVEEDEDGRDQPAGLRWHGPTETHGWSDPLTVTSVQMKAVRERGSVAPQELHDLGGALANASRLIDDRLRSAALGRLVSHLTTADQLATVLDTMPYGDRSLLCAVVRRAGEVVTDDLVFAGLLRRALHGVGRRTCTAVLAAALSRLAVLTGHEGIDWLDATLAQAHRWWP